MSGFGGTSRAVVSKAFAGGAKLKSMVANVAKEIPGVTVDTKNIDIQDLSIGNQGWSHAGMATEWLDRLARVYGFSWWINDGVFAVAPTLPFSKWAYKNFNVPYVWLY